ncbi:UDP-N-acetylmuramoyl-tripeptide--D-alanyl-D-alanine ligase [Mucilaginibacter auburnensis]|uniref:UDP-N-acetylmuramoyl-tripeptide--D-alanyl-D-alanine ligase n=1 Tax=Mucilaginibacter auburnensis TaxID=1457233 RepID=A0A2H9VRK3_9SPHI|nr:UDP-N-acetylmuramoyl-tripeptide--D-alanyl-D-alanine ligase [Mucilaginibacter auburnensis]PJJ83441.1 UDP-N-acetylmuramoyl-tripeptide--D-alanyl-D-alanine ligase [Mucilaginibacter auburnensis]
MTTEELYQIYLQHPVITTDTRKITKGSLFFALKGENFDANTFAAQAIEAGAAYAVIDNAEYNTGDKFILVPEVLTALQDLASHHRRQLNIPVVGLTGSNGKTTTKELINAVLSQKFNTLATQGNLNNHIGVPLTVLSINSSHEAAVVEMGANHVGEIALLSSISQPSHGMITNVGKAHLEGFGGVEGIKKGKGELYDFLSNNNRQAFVNSNNPILMEMQEARKFTTPPIFYGDAIDDLVSAEITGNAPFLSLRWTNNTSGESYDITTQLTGSYNLDNILVAICMGVHFKLSAEEINRGIENYQPNNNRSQVVKTANNTLICDYYNANPTSMLAAIENVDKLTAAQKVVVLGDMFELGEEAEAEHKAIVEKAIITAINRRIFIGKEFYKLKNNSAEFYETRDAAAEALRANPIKGATVLIKGSRGMALEKLVELF